MFEFEDFEVRRNSDGTTDVNVVCPSCGGSTGPSMSDTECLVCFGSGGVWVRAGRDQDGNLVATDEVVR